MKAPTPVEALSGLETISRGLIFLDDLIERGASLETVVTQAAAMFDCLLGVRTAEGDVLTSGPQGRLGSAPTAPRGAHRRTLPDGTEVWLAACEDGPASEPVLTPASLPSAEEIILRRFGVAVRAAIFQRASTKRARAVDLLAILDPESCDEDRIPALRRLGLQGGSMVTLMAFAGPEAAVERIVEQIRARAPAVYHVVEDSVHLVLARDLISVTDLRVPAGVRGAFTPAQSALRAPDAWRQARNALRFAVPSTRESGAHVVSDAVMIDSASLGAYAILAEELTAEGIAQIADVQRLDRLYQECGPEMLRTMLAVAATDSLRMAARTVHMHHNSVAHRVERAEKVLGFSCTEPYGRARLLLTLTLHRLLESRKLF